MSHLLIYFLAISEKSQRTRAVWSDYVPLGPYWKRLFWTEIYGFGTSSSEYLCFGGSKMGTEMKIVRWCAKCYKAIHILSVFFFPVLFLLWPEALTPCLRITWSACFFKKKWVLALSQIARAWSLQMRLGNLNWWMGLGHTGVTSVSWGCWDGRFLGSWVDEWQKFLVCKLRWED